MKKIICYGDSNTFGFNPVDGTRYGEDTRWTALLQKKLSSEYKIINEGCCDRTGFIKNPKGFIFSGNKHFPKFISNQKDIDVLIFWVGTNDLQSQYNITMGTIEKGLEDIIDLASEKAKNIIIIPPVILSENVLEGSFSFQFNETSVTKSRKIGRIFRQLANVKQCLYFDINKITSPSDFDGLHYDETSHKLIACSLYDFIKDNIK